MILKQIPEDFIVKEKLRLKMKGGPYSYFRLKKAKWNTIDAINELVKRLGIKRKAISFAGIKDRQAVTEQYISIFNGQESFNSIDIKDIKLEYLGKGKEKVHTGLLKGNEFIITVRGLDKECKTMLTSIPNYFDEQRFGRGDNKGVGKAIVQGDFNKACEILGLNVDKNDYLGVLKKEKKDLLALYVNSYQSWLFNEVLTELIRRRSKKNFEIKYSMGNMMFPKEKIKGIKIPLINFDAEFEDKEIEEIYGKLLMEEGVGIRDFVIRQMPELAAMTAYREAFVDVQDFQYISFDEDELNEGKFKQVVSFTLGKGSYATIVIKSLYGGQNE